ncbi:unnamed protein product [Schistosoma bovis]|nr:unnamed protein product [Schistosoma bovis]CAH8456970.1 unnamed protein product [Schistosoma bovis]
MIKLMHSFLQKIANKFTRIIAKTGAWELIYLFIVHKYTEHCIKGCADSLTCSRLIYNKIHYMKKANILHVYRFSYINKHRGSGQ